jgi:CheY-like chemotaxis protein
MKAFTILVVDDHAEMARALAALARGLGYNVTTAHGGQEALESVRRSPPDLVVLDLQMPGVSGFDVLRELRADPRFERLPVVICSAASSPYVRDEVLRLGAQDFVSKENAFEQLAGAFARQLGGQRVSL